MTDEVGDHGLSQVQGDVHGVSHVFVHFGSRSVGLPGTTRLRLPTSTGAIHLHANDRGAQALADAVDLTHVKER